MSSQCQLLFADFDAHEVTLDVVVLEPSDPDVARGEPLALAFRALEPHDPLPVCRSLERWADDLAVFSMELVSDGALELVLRRGAEEIVLRLRPGEARG